MIAPVLKGKRNKEWLNTVVFSRPRTNFKAFGFLAKIWV
jgi:hypothetical protein